MKSSKNIFFLLILVCFTGLGIDRNAEALTDRPKVGLVLSGGGARGFAHISILKMIDSLEIPVDYIAGTSMGGIMGALYAVGYSGAEIEDIVLSTDWQEIFTDNPPRNKLPFFQKKDMGKYQIEFGMQGLRPQLPSGLIFGQKISLLFSSLTFPYEHITDFTQLPIPYHCVAVNIETGKEIILKHGSLAKAMRSTMAIPSAFSPIQWGDSLLVDGGMVNNMPVDVVKSMGADLVVAVDVGVPMRRKQNLNSAIAVLEQSIAMLGINKWEENKEASDIYIHPDLIGFGVGDFDNIKISQIIKRGALAAKETRAQLSELKQEYQLVRMTDTESCPVFPEQQRLHSIQIVGYKSVSFQTLYHELGFRPGDIFNCPLLEEKLEQLKSSFDFESIRYELIPESETTVKLVVRVTEKVKPIIHGISITGNENLPFYTIYQLLGIAPGDALDINELNRRIMTTYGLGYFENIRYSIEPREKHQVHLNLTVKELKKRKLRFGFRYDSRYKLVGMLGIQGMNTFLPGLRYEHELQFGGLTHYRFKTYYPSQTLNLPVYPFLRFEAQDVPVGVFDLFTGDQAFEYDTKNIELAGGFGLLIGKMLNLEVEYQQEQINIKPRVAFGDPRAFPSWNERLRTLRASLVLDRLDNRLVPTNGVYLSAIYENSMEKLNTELPYELYEVYAELYYTLLKRHTFRFYGFSGRGDNTPIYKMSNQGHPSTFVGMQYGQFIASEMNILRLDYRLRFSSGLHLKLIANTAFDILQESQFYRIETDVIYGVGAGVTLVSPVGPFDIIWSRGHRGFGGHSEKQNVFYFQFGTDMERFLFQ